MQMTWTFQCPVGKEASPGIWERNQASQAVCVGRGHKHRSLGSEAGPGGVAGWEEQSCRFHMAFK